MSGELVGPGALARDRMSRSPEVAVACDDLARLADWSCLEPWLRQPPVMRRT